MRKLLRKINFKIHEKEIDNFTFTISLLYSIVESKDYILDNEYKESFYDTVIALSKYCELLLKKCELTKNDLFTIKNSIKNLYVNYYFIF